jgi:N-acetyl-anhydromuramyl-L-alanine amidase AmpD
MRYRVPILLLFCAAIVAGTFGPGTSAGAQTGSSLDAEFEAAAERYGVPKELLLAMGYVNTRWEMPPPEASEHEEGEAKEGAPEARGAYGIMQLVQNPSRDTLSEAAALTGSSEEQLKTDREENIWGGAALLSGMQGEPRPEDLDEWYEAVAEYGSGPLYAEQVYEVLQRGASAEISSGEEVTLAPQEGVEPYQLVTAQAAGEYPGSTWYGASSSNYTSANRPSSNPVNKIVVHVTQGSWSGALSWFNDSKAKASAHYTVRSSDGFVGQSVREKDIAWHAGNWSYNQTSIGIEHEGYVSDSKWFTEAMYVSSAKLSAHLAKKYDIPIDRDHIIGHDEVPDPDNPGQYGGASHHTDPGSYWDWDKYMSYVRYYAGDTSSETYNQVVDNSDPDRFHAASNWGSSSWNSQRYGSDYKFAKPGRRYKGASFKVDVPAKDSYDVYGWWPADSGYNSRAVFRIYTLSGWVKKTVDQRTNGGTWVYLGTYTLEAGDDWKIAVSNRSSGKGYIIADAVKVVRK